MPDPLAPTMFTKIRAFARGEQNAGLLEALRQAGKSAYQELLTAEQARVHTSPWDATPAVAGQLLASWNSYVLQILGEALLDADYAADPGTVGYVPEVTFGQVSEWFGAVEGWLSRARQARSNPEHDLSAELALPAALPPWIEVDPCPQEHLTALLAAVPPIREHAEVALHALDAADLTPERRSIVNKLKQMGAEASAAVDYALGLRTPKHNPRLHELIENNLKQALELWFQIGQLAAMPRLLSNGYRPPRAAARPDVGRLPGGPRFDPWCLTDPKSLTRWRGDRRARQAVKEMWEFDDNPGRTLSVKAEIDAALAAGDIAPIKIKGGGTCYYECPWPALYEVRRPVRIMGQALRVMQQFTFRTSADDIPAGGRFTRELVTGPFRATNEIDYCDPDGEH